MQQAGLARDLRSSVERLSGERGDEELYDLFFAWALASISTYIFGPGAAVNLLNDLTEARRLQEVYNDERLVGLWVSSWFYLPRRLLRWIGYPTEISCIEEMRRQAERACATHPQEKSTEPRFTACEYMKNEMLREPPGGTGREAKQPSSNQQSAISSEMQDHVVAGFDTSIITLTICARLLSLDSNRTWQKKSRAEARRFHGSVEAVEVEKLPILNAIVKETLRLYAPVAGRQLHVTNKTMPLEPEGHQVTVPGGVTVHAQAWTLHRNNSIFPDPEEWRPDRWLDCSPEQRKEMDAWLWAFGSGSRMCLGEHLALSLLKVALVAVYSGLGTRVTENTEFTLNIGNMLLPVSQDGGVLRLRVDKVEA